MKQDNTARERTEDELYEEAYITACERMSPNAPEFDALVERIFEELLDIE